LGSGSRGAPADVRDRRLACGSGGVCPPRSRRNIQQRQRQQQQRQQQATRTLGPRNAEIPYPPFIAASCRRSLGQLTRGVVYTCVFHCTGVRDLGGAARRGADSSESRGRPSLSEASRPFVHASVVFCYSIRRRSISVYRGER
jgi:hypothetical protein